MAWRKNTNIERLRIIAAYGIICFHSQSGFLKEIGYAGLPAFVMVTFSFGLIGLAQVAYGPGESHFKKYMVSKINRLLLPYFFWVIIYGVWGCARMLSSRGEIINVPITIFFPLYGTSIHLWYLPFVFLGLVILSYMKEHFLMKSHFALFAFSTATILTGLLPVFIPDINNMPLPVPQVVYALPALFLGLIISDTLQVRIPLKYLLAVMIIFFTGVVRLISSNDHSYLLLYLISFIVVVIAKNIPGKHDDITEKLSPLTFGIYLVHPIIISIVANVFGYHNSQGLRPIHSVLIFILSALTIYFSKKTKIKNFV